MIRGLYGFIRHPILVGFMIAFWATPVMTVGHLLFAAMTTGYILVVLEFEESDLLAMDRANYGPYRQRTPMLIPRVTPGMKASVKSASVEAA